MPFWFEMWYTVIKKIKEVSDSMRTVAMVLLLVIVAGAAAGVYFWDAFDQEITHLQRQIIELRRTLEQLAEERRAEPQHSADTVTVYFMEVSDTDFILRPEQRQVESPKTPERAVNALIDGPETDLHRILPQGTELRSVDVVNGIARVNFSEELRSNFNLGSQGEALLVQSVVRTLAGFPKITHVQFLIEGSSFETIGGHLAVNEPLPVQDY